VKMEGAAKTSSVRGGPRSAAGRARSARNRLSHGLARSIRSDPASAAAIAALTQQLSQQLAPLNRANTPSLTLPRKRGRESNGATLPRILKREWDGATLPREQGRQWAEADPESRELAHDVAEAQVDLMRVRRARHDLLFALDKLVADASAEAQQLIAQATVRLVAIDRYEQRARSHCRRAARAFDALQGTQYKNTTSLAVRTQKNPINSAAAAEEPAAPAPLSGVAPDLTLVDDSKPSRHMQAALLDDRGVVRVAGEDARKFLNGLLTTDIGKVAAGRPSYAALLTPQGKIIVDFLIAEASDGVFLLDCPRAQVETLVQRLSFYKLRAKVTIEDVSEHLQVFAVWEGSPVVPAKAGTQTPGTMDPRLREDDRVAAAFPDPRLSTLGFRLIAEGGTNITALLDAEKADTADYAAHRIALGVPEGGVDFAYNDAFPHEADMDQLGGVDFKKGCFIGQEVVSRMEHRGTARSRVVPVTSNGAPPAPGTPVIAGGKSLGAIGSAAGGDALALLRLDRVAEALAEGATLEAGGITLTLRKPTWARFAFPGEEKAVP